MSRTLTLLSVSNRWQRPLAHPNAQRALVLLDMRGYVNVSGIFLFVKSAADNVALILTNIRFTTKACRLEHCS